MSVLLTGASATYIPRLIYFIYVEWTAGFDPLVQTLQMYPALLMVVQMLYQGTFLLRAYARPSSLRTIAKTHPKDCKLQLEANAVLNCTLLLHCICITAVIESCIIEKNIVFQLAVGEMVYRLWAAVAFLHLRWKIEEHCDETDEQSEETSMKAVILSVGDHTHSTVTSSSRAFLENDSTESTGSVCENEVDSSPSNTSMETLSTEDHIGHDIDETVAPVDDDIAPTKNIVQATDYEQNYFKVIMQQFFKSAHDQDLDLVSPQQCTDEEPSRGRCTVVIPKTTTSLKFNFS